MRGLRQQPTGTKAQKHLLSDRGLASAQQPTSLDPKQNNILQPTAKITTALLLPLPLISRTIRVQTIPLPFLATRLTLILATVYLHDYTCQLHVRWGILYVLY